MYYNNITGLDKIINNPIHVTYEKEKKSLLYYGKINEYVCCVVKIRITKNDCYVATVYPVNEKKLNKVIEQSYIKQ